MKKITHIVGAAFAIFLASATQAQQRPNIIVILVDDMGYSDLGCFGSEIQTPHLDSLAKEGTIMTNFYNAARCCPSRASLLTGRYPHQAGIGDMMNKRPFPSYQGFLNRESITLAELLKSAGYGTYMTGKWHVGQDSINWPLERGFDRYYGLIDGANSYFANRPYRKNQKLSIVLDRENVEVPANYYSTDAYTGRMINFLETHLAEKKEQPFFAYMAYQTPHWPLHARPEEILKYKGKYMEGWETIRQRRFDKQKELGIIPSSASLPENDEEIPAWDKLTWVEKVQWDERMAVYAAMLDRLDQQVGRLVDFLKAKKQLEHTIILFLSDNGASHETIDHDGFTEEIQLANNFPASHPESFTAYGKMGAAVSNTPYRSYKHWVYEGGNSTSFIAFGPNHIPKGAIVETPAHLVDIMPSLQQWANANYPKRHHNQRIGEMEGTALSAIWNNSGLEERAICFEHEGNKAIRKGRWKLVQAYNDKNWQLYDLQTDRAERIDLSSKYPKEVQSLLKEYLAWEKRVGVIPYEQLSK